MPQEGSSPRRPNKPKPSADHLGLTPEQERYWHARRGDVLAFEDILGARRVDNGTSAHHLWNGTEFPADLPAGRDRADLWTWTAAATCPLFHQDRNAFMLIEDKIRADRLEEIYVRELFSAQRLDLDPAQLTHGDVFELLTAKTEMKLFCALATYLFARDNDLLPK